VRRISILRLQRLVKAPACKPLRFNNWITGENLLTTPRLSVYNCLAPLIRDVWGFEVVRGKHIGSSMVEVDFGNPDPPITE